VGSGKTLVALMGALAAAEAGLQTAIMVPTELIARQHAMGMAKMVEAIGVRVVLLTGSVKGKAREQALEDIASGGAHIIVGTHALFQESVEFHKLGFVVIDEQHRFGVAQRMALANKGDNPHLLHMTATPIPRSLTMTMYGDMECTFLREKPAGRQAITTRIIPTSRMEEVMEAMRKAIARGEKIYWICPLIEDDSAIAKDDVAAAEARYITFKAAFGEKAVGLVHGRQKADERDAAMQRFARGDTKLLVATTVVEVGVDVRDATIIIIEQAERFGLSQLHQLRGRVGRGEKASSCVLLYNDISGEIAQARLLTLRESEDGFYIAEEDLRLRGGGDLLGLRQSGMALFRFTDLALHAPLILRSKAEVAEILKKDPSLADKQNEGLKVLLGLFGYEWNY
jgi:ATP-dependent DNA helicase RecG